jgi:O-methyltransferase involved in polyketide biosynthesis
MEGISMYLAPKELTKLLSAIAQKYENVRVLIDCYTDLAAKLSKHRNPVKDVGVTNVYGVDNANMLTGETGLTFVREWELTPAYMIDELHGFEKALFKKLYAGTFSKKLYKMYEYEKTR